MAPRPEEAGTCRGRWGWGRLASAQAQSQAWTVLWFPILWAPRAVACFHRLELVLPQRCSSPSSTSCSGDAQGLQHPLLWVQT